MAGPTLHAVNIGTGQSRPLLFPSITRLSGARAQASPPDRPQIRRNPRSKPAGQQASRVNSRMATVRRSASPACLLGLALAPAGCSAAGWRAPPAGCPARRPHRMKPQANPMARFPCTYSTLRRSHGHDRDQPTLVAAVAGMAMIGGGSPDGVPARVHVQRVEGVGCTDQHAIDMNRVLQGLLAHRLDVQPPFWHENFASELQHPQLPQVSPVSSSQA